MSSESNLMLQNVVDNEKLLNVFSFIPYDDIPSNDDGDKF